MRRPLFVIYKEAEKEGTLYNLVSDLEDTELSQLWFMTGDEEVGEEIDRRKGKI